MGFVGTVGPEAGLLVGVLVDGLDVVGLVVGPGFAVGLSVVGTLMVGDAVGFTETGAFVGDVEVGELV